MIVFSKNLKFKTQPQIVLFLLFLLPKKKKKNAKFYMKNSSLWEIYTFPQRTITGM